MHQHRKGLILIGFTVLTFAFLQVSMSSLMADTSTTAATFTTTESALDATVNYYFNLTLTSVALTATAQVTSTLTPYPSSVIQTELARKFETLVTNTATPTFTFTPVPSQTPLPATIRKDGKGVAQVWVPAGCFVMGSDPSKDKNAQDNEMPSHPVCLTHGYWLDQFSVSNDAYRKFVADGGYSKPGYWSSDGWVWAKNHSNPVDEDNGYTAPLQPRVDVTWWEAEAYAQWRGCRLPTEAEWEFAARGPKSLIYPWGDAYQDKVSNTNRELTTLVENYPKGVSWVKAFNMVGNVQEWIADTYEKTFYQQDIETDPKNIAEGGTRVLRGGGWDQEPIITRRAAYRNDNDPWAYDNDIGIRIVCDN